MDHNYTLYEDHLEVQVCGDFVMQEAINKFAILLAYCRETDRRKVILDYSQVNNMPSGTLRYLYQFSLEDKYRKYMLECNKSISFASIHHTILRPEKPVPENDTFLFNMKNHLCPNLEEARILLKVKSTQSGFPQGR